MDVIIDIILNNAILLCTAWLFDEKIENMEEI